MEGRLNKEDSKYLKTAIRLLRQGNTMLLHLSEKTDLDIVSEFTASVHDDIERILEDVDKISEYIVTDRYVQLSLDFDGDERK